MARPPTWTPFARSPGKHGLFVIEDAAQAIGAAYKGKRAGGLGDVAALSFYPSKNLGGFGDGGMIVTDDPVLGRSMARLRVHGMEPKYYHHEVGINSRLDAIQAAVLRVKLAPPRRLDAQTPRGRQRAIRGLFELHGLTDLIGLPRERDGYFHVFNQYVIRVPGAASRSPARLLTARQVGTEIYYPIPLHLQPCFAPLGHKPGDFPSPNRPPARPAVTVAENVKPLSAP